MIVAVACMLVVQMPLDEIIYVTRMRHGFMTARIAVFVRRRVGGAIVTGRATSRICFRISQLVLVDMSFVRVMKVAVMKVVGMIVVFHARVTTGVTMLVVVSSMGVVCHHSVFVSLIYSCVWKSNLRIPNSRRKLSGGGTLAMHLHVWILK